MTKKRHIRQILLRNITLILFATLVVSLVAAGVLLHRQARNQAGDTLKARLDDTLAVASDFTDVAELSVLSDMAGMIDPSDPDDSFGVDAELLWRFADNRFLSFIDLVLADGTIAVSSDEARQGKSYASDPRSKELLQIAKNEIVGSKNYDAWPLQGNQPMYLTYTYTSAGSENPVIVVFGETQEIHQRLMSVFISDVAHHRRVGEYGGVLYCNSALEVQDSVYDELKGTAVSLTHDIDEICDQNLLVNETIADISVYVRAARVDRGANPDDYLLAVYPEWEAQRALIWARIALIVFCTVAFVALTVLIDRKIRQHVSDRVASVNRALGQITAGDLGMRVDETDSIEFEQLSQGINTTVDKLEDLIQQEARRLDEELALARMIQRAALPCVFPPFPEHKDFGLFASMDAAREVGGDFYDFFMVSDDELAVIVADVSEKGIPAAMFMMQAKTVVKAFAVSGLPVDEVVMQANDELCEDNEAGMFLTAWLGILNLKTGVVKYVHAGHTCPVLVSRNETSLVRKRRNFIMGGQPGMPYLCQEVQLRPGDALFLYSDGVTEAFNAQDELYGSGRLEDVLARASEQASDEDPNQYCERVCAAVKQDVSSFTAGAQQSDDITMLCVRYEGPR